MGSPHVWLILFRGSLSIGGTGIGQKMAIENASGIESATKSRKLHSITVFENHRKSIINHCERSELRLHFEWTKVIQKCQKWSILASFWKPDACGQTVLPDRSVLIGKKLVVKTNIQKFKCDILSNFQTMCISMLINLYCVLKDLL